MNGREARRHELVARLGVLGGGLGVVAGLVQVLAGARIATWSGDKADPVPLGLLTVVLSLVAVAASRWQLSPHRGAGARAISGLAMLLPGLLCFTTVGRLWVLPGLVLVPAALLAVDDWRATGRTVGSSYPRCLLAALGGAELLMAAGAKPLLMVVGTVGGLFVVAASLLPRPSRPVLVGLALLGTAPFALLASTAVVPALLPLIAAALASAAVHPVRSGPNALVQPGAGPPR